MLIIKAAFYSTFLHTNTRMYGAVHCRQNDKRKLHGETLSARGSRSEKFFLHRAEAQLSDYGKTLISNFMAKIAIFPESGE